MSFKDIQSTMSFLMKNGGKIKEMGQQYQDMLRRNELIEVVGRAALGDLEVRATVTLSLRVQRLEIPEAVRNAPDLLNGLVLSAINNALDIARTRVQQETQALSSSLGLPDNLPLG